MMLPGYFRQISFHQRICEIFIMNQEDKMVKVVCSFPTPESLAEEAKKLKLLEDDR